MLGQGIDLIQWLAGTRQLPVAFELGLMKQRPLENELRRPGGQRTFDDRAVKRDRRLSVTVPGMEVRNLVCSFVLVHRNHDPKERADAWHPPILATVSVGFGTAT